MIGKTSKLLRKHTKNCASNRKRRAQSEGMECESDDWETDRYLRGDWVEMEWIEINYYIRSETCVQTTIWGNDCGVRPQLGPKYSTPQSGTQIGTGLVAGICMGPSWGRTRTLSSNNRHLVGTVSSRELTVHHRLTVYVFFCYSFRNEDPKKRGSSYQYNATLISRLLTSLNSVASPTISQ